MHSPRTRDRDPFWHGLEYRQLYWCDHIAGTKDQIQALGIGAGEPFPGEPGAAKRKMCTTDPRGLPVEIERRTGQEGRFYARVLFQDLPERPDAMTWELSAFAGVERATASTRVDVWRGTAEALVRASLVPPGHFPGMPGMKKATVTIYADGTMPAGRMPGPEGLRHAPGARVVMRASKSRYDVRVCLSDEECERRQAAADAEMDEWKRRVRALPRPAPLFTPTTPVQPATLDEAVYRYLDRIGSRVGEDEVQRILDGWGSRQRVQQLRTHHLRLAWSAPTQ